MTVVTANYRVIAILGAASLAAILAVLVGRAITLRGRLKASLRAKQKP